MPKRKEKNKYSYALSIECCTHLIALAVILFPAVIFAQGTGTLMGTVKDHNTQETLTGANIVLEGTSWGASCDPDGRFILKNISPQTYNVVVRYIGYQSRVIRNVVITSGNIVMLDIELTEAVTGLNEVVVEAPLTFGKSPETPLSIQNLSVEEIRNNPGGNFDISKVIQALPGVGGASGGASFRNDITIRGGGPNENVYYLDGIEIAQINHFSTQGSAGGPAGILNVSFIEEVSVSSGSFNSKYDNTLSSVLSFRQRDGNPERIQGNIRLSATEFATTFDGPLCRNTTFLISARKSYLDFLFQLIDIPIRPNYWDFQYKTTTNLSHKTTLTTLGVGAIDYFRFAAPSSSSPEKEYVLRSVPTINQWNYTQGIILKHLFHVGFYNIALSRNMFNNELDKFADAREGNENYRTLKVRSQEIENKLRCDINQYTGKWMFSYGGMVQYVKYNNRTFNLVSGEIFNPDSSVLQPAIVLNFNSAIDFFKVGVFADITCKLADNRLAITVGTRLDGNTFINDGMNLVNTFSPRVSATYSLSGRWNINATIGRYYKIPIYTVLGFRDNTGNLVNKNNRYIGANHYVLGVEYLPARATRITFESFVKTYDHYPVSEQDGISLANLGTDFGIMGNEKVNSIGKGRSYGCEVFFQQKLTKKIYATFSYTFVRSEFTGGNTSRYIPSSWDYRHLVSGILGHKFNRGWELGLKYRFVGGAPYTPFDMDASQANYATLGTGILDYTRLNTLRLNTYNQLDIRLDKKYNFNKWSIDLYMDVQNALGINNPAAPDYTFKRTADNSGWLTTDGNSLKPDGSNAIPMLLDDSSATIIPSIGFVIEF
jgi:hypothetical protein